MYLTHRRSGSRQLLQNLCPQEVCHGSLKTLLQIGQIKCSSGWSIKFITTTHIVYPFKTDSLQTQLSNVLYHMLYNTRRDFFLRLWSFLELMLYFRHMIGVALARVSQGLSRLIGLHSVFRHQDQWLRFVKVSKACSK